MIRWLLPLALLLTLPPGCDILKPPPQVPYDCDAPPAASGLLKVEHPIAGQYIVKLKPIVPGSEALATPGAMAAQYPLRDVRPLRSFGGFAAAADATTAAKLASDPRVVYVSEVGTKSISVVASWGTDRVDERAKKLDGIFAPFATGENVHVIVVDTGVNCSDPIFAGRCGEGHSAVGGTPDDGHGHGSHVAGTAVSVKFGIATKAVLHSCRALNAQGQGSDSQVAECIDWTTDLCVRNAWACVANMSLGGSASRPLDEALCRSIKAGVSWAVAAGNDNLGACQYSPAHVKQALTVGASTKQDHTASFSNDGPCVDLYAPGEDITSVGGDMSGTSMASPHVAGGAALCAEKAVDKSPAGVANCVLGLATKDVLGGIGSDSPNLLLYVGSGENPPPSSPPPCVADPAGPYCSDNGGKYPCWQTSSPGPPGGETLCTYACSADSFSEAQPCPPKPTPSPTIAPTPTAPPTTPPTATPTPPGPEPTPDTCPCAWKFGLSEDPNWIDKNFKRVPQPVEGGSGTIDSTQKFTSRNVACDPGHPNCGGRECNDPRGPLFRIVAPTALLSCDDSKGKACTRDDPWHVKVGSKKTPMVKGTYTVTATLRPDAKDALGKPVALCKGAPNPPATTRAWTAK